MTDDKVGKGPYGIKNRNHWWHVDGLGEENRMNQWAYKIGAEWWASKLNDSYASGRASRDGLRTTLKGFLEDNLDYAKINNLPGVENKHWIKAARAALRADEERN